MNISKIFLFIILSLFLGSPLSAETIYRDANGNKISHEEYQQLAVKHKSAFKSSRQKETKKAHSVIQKKRGRKHMTKRRNLKNNKNVPVDSFGRPLKDSNGRWITYPGDEAPGVVTTGYGERVKEENANRRRLDRDKRAEFKWGRYF